jgi:hypothetical protein
LNVEYFYYRSDDEPNLFHLYESDKADPLEILRSSMEAPPKIPSTPSHPSYKKPTVIFYDF